MAGFTERISFVVDAVTGSAEKNLKGLRTELNQTDGFTGKAKAGMSSLAGVIKENLGAALLGGGAALAAFGMKAVGQFQELALQADKMAAATGLSVQEASRWIETAGDLGVTAETVQGALNKLNRVAASEDLTKYGITAQGANDRLIETLQYLQGITDETQRATEGQKLLGKSWTELAPLVATAGNLRDLLADVSDAKVIDPDEVEKAKRYRDTMDNLNGIFEDLTLTAGEFLVPALSDVAEAISGIKDAIDSLPSPPSWLVNLLTPSWKDLISPLPGGSGDLARTPQDILFPPKPMPEIPDAGTYNPSGLFPELDRKAMAGRASVTVNNNYYPASTDGRDVDRGLQEYYRRNGGDE